MRKFFCYCFFIIVTCLTAKVYAGREILTLETYYPAPYGSYFEITTVGKTTLATDGTSNVGIGTVTPNAAALLEMSSTTKGFLPPRMSAVQRAAIVAPPAGLMIYNTTTNKLNFYNGSVWEIVTSV